MRWRLFAHPCFTGSLAVLAVNDHLLKGRAPGAVTGKLSDFAGVFLVAVALAALTERPRLSCCLSGLGFAAIKARFLGPCAPERPIGQHVLTVASAMVAVFAVSATSYARPPSVDGFVVDGDGTVFARVYDETYNDEGQSVPSRSARSNASGSKRRQTWATRWGSIDSPTSSTL